MMTTSPGFLGGWADEESIWRLSEELKDLTKSDFKQTL